jgi:hypothetical protein
MNSNPQFIKIKKIVNEAIGTWHTKKSANIYISELLTMSSFLPNDLDVKINFEKLIGHVKEAAGQGKDKQHWMYFVERDMVTLEWAFDKIEANIKND